MNHVATQIRCIAGISSAERPASRFLTVKFAFLAMLLVLATAAWAQDNASVTGTVTDASGAVVANVNISLTNTATGQVRQATSNTSGGFLFANVGAGGYTLSAAVQGFQKYVKTD